MIAFYGAGLLGTGFVTCLRRRGEAVHVWNRTHDKARALEATGAVAFEDPAKAASGASRVHVVLSDDAAVDALLDRIVPSLAQGTVVVDHTTTTAHGTVARVARLDAAGIRLVHAPVFMGPQNAHDATGIMLVSGARDRVQPLAPELERMTGKLVDLGDRPDAAACMKLLGNMFLMFLTSGLSEMFALGGALDVPPAQVAQLFSFFNPGATLPARIERMLGAEFGKTSWGLDMARKDAGLMLDEAAKGGATLPVLEAIAARMDAMIARGHAKDDWTVLAKDALDGTRAAAAGPT